MPRYLEPRYLKYDALAKPSNDEFGVIVNINPNGTVDVDVAVPNDNLGNVIRLTNVPCVNGYVPKIGEWVHIGIYDGIQMVDRSVPNPIVDISTRNTVIVNPNQIASQIIDSAHIRYASIGSAHIQNAAIGSAHIQNAAIGSAHIQNAAITNAHIAGLSADKITSGTIDASRINVINLNASNITTGTLSANRIYGGTLSGVTISVSTDATVGRNLYLGSLSDNSYKNIYFSNRASITGNYGSYAGGLKLSTHDGVVLECEAGGADQITCRDNAYGVAYFHLSSPWYTGISNQGHPMIRARSRYNYQAGALKFVGDGSQQYVQVRNYNDNGYIPIDASSFRQSSSKELKENIRDATFNATDILRRARVRQFNYKTEPDATRVGFIAEEAPCEFKCRDNDDTISIGDVLAIAVKAIQELDTRMATLEARLNRLSQTIDQIGQSPPTEQ